MNILSTILILIIVISFSTSGTSAENSLKHEIQSAFVYKFIKFIDWENSSHIDDEGNICVSVLGKGSINGPISKINQKEVKGNKINVWFINSLDELKECKILFIPPEINFDIKNHSEHLKSIGVLTISEKKNFAQSGGIINFITVNNRLNFEINLEQARSSNITISSKLLQLAKVVGNGSFAK